MIAASLTGTSAGAALLMRTAVGLLAVIAAARSNHVLNELLDAPFDRQHPTKRLRAAASGSISVPLVMLLAWALLGEKLSG